MKEAYVEYTRVIEARAILYISRIKTAADHDRCYPAALALCRVVGDFTGEDRWDVYDRLRQVIAEREAA